MFSFKVEIWLVAWSQTAFNVFFFLPVKCCNYRILCMISYIWLLIGILLWNRTNLHSGKPMGKLCWRQRCHQNSEFYQPLTDVNCWISILPSVSRTPSPPIPDDSANPGLNWGSGQNLCSIAGSEHWLHVSVKFHLPREGQRGLAPQRSSIFPPYRLFSAVRVLWRFHAGGAFAAAASSSDSGRGTSLLVPLRHSSVS